MSKPLKKKNTNSKNSKGSGPIAVVSGLINDVREYQNNLNSFYQDGITDEKIDTILKNPVVESKLILKMNKALEYPGAYNYSGVKKSVSKYFDDEFSPSFRWRDLAKQVIYAHSYARAVIRVYWDEENNIVKTRSLDHRLFSYNNDYAKGDIGDLIYNNINLSKKYPYNFIVIYNDVDAKSPFGKSDLRNLYTTVMFWNLMQTIEARYMNKSVIPSFVAGYETTKVEKAAEEENRNITEVLSQIENGSAAAVAGLKSLHTLLVNGQVNFNSIYERLQNIISIAILGSDMTDSKKNGTYAQAKVGSEYIDGNIKDLAIEIQDIANIIGRWQIWAKFGREYKAPQYAYDLKSPYSADLILKMLQIGVPVSWSEANKVMPMPKYAISPEDDVLRLENQTEAPNNTPNNKDNNKDGNADDSSN